MLKFMLIYTLYLFYSVKGCIFVGNNNTNDMTNTMKLSIETYANLTNRTYDEVLEQMQSNKVIQDAIMKLMFCVS